MSHPLHMEVIAAGYGQLLQTEGMKAGGLVKSVVGREIDQSTILRLIV